MAADDDESIPFHRYAFHNVYNYTFMSGVLAAAALNQNWWLLVAGAGVEALWMVFGPDSRLLRHKVFKRWHGERTAADERKRREAKLGSLPASEGHRVDLLMNRRDELVRVCNENPAFEASLMAAELKKLESLVDSFIELIVATSRYERYLAGIDLGDLEADIRKYERQLEIAGRSGKDGGKQASAIVDTFVKVDANPAEEQRALAQKNLGVLLKRRDKLAEIKGFVSRARSQMELIENTFDLLSDQIVSMRSPKELDGQLDALMDGVEAVRGAAREASALLEAAN